MSTPTKFPVPKYKRNPDPPVADDFFLNKNNLQLVARFKEKIERMYQIEMKFGDEVEDGRWLVLEGVPVDRRNAKNYITALCHPVERQEIQFPSATCIEFTDEATLEQIERQTNAVIKPLKKIAEFEICGTDLAVTLAMSLMEELVDSTETCDVGAKGEESATNANMLMISPSSQAGAHRLSSTLERALSQHSDGICSVEDYKQTPDAVKRVLVNCLADTTADDIEDDLLFSGGLGSRVQHSKESTSIEMDGDARGTKDIGKRTSPGLSDKLTSATLKSGPAVIPAVSKQHEYLRNFGASVGYSKDEVAEALQFVDEKTRPSDFLDLLNTVKQKSEADQSAESEPDVVILETKTIDLTGDSSPEPAKKGGRNKPSTMDEASFPKGLPDTYKERLLIDFFQEDENCSVEELKRRNAERQKLLKLNFQQQKHMPATKQPVKQRPATDTDTSHKKKGPTKLSKKQRRDESTKQVVKTVSDSNTYEDDDDQTCVFTHWQAGTDTGNVHINTGCSATQMPQPSGSDIGTTPKRKQSKGQAVPKPHMATPAAKTYPRQQSPSRDKNQVRAKPTQVVTPSSVPPAPHGWSQQLAVPPATHPPELLRYIVIDGSNVAMTHGNGKYFSCKGLRICVDYFKQRGHTKIMVFVPHWRRARPREENPITDQNILDELKDEECLVFTPSRRIGRKLVAAYDDRYVLELAEAEDGVIVSNDQYRDLMQEKANWKSLIEERLLMYSFVKDRFMPPNDPLGRDGPCLDVFLRREHKQPGPGATRPYEPSSSSQPQMYPAHQNPQFHHNMSHGQIPMHSQWHGQGQNPGYNQLQGQGQFPVYNQGQGFNQTVPISRWKPPVTGQFTQPAMDVSDGHSQISQPQHRHQGQHMHQGQYVKEFPKTAGSSRAGRRLSERSEEVTDSLYQELKTIFPEEHQEEKLRQVLANHERETDLTKLTNYCISVLFG